MRNNYVEWFFTQFLRYLFNCSEGTGRIMLDNSMKWQSIQNIFVTRTNWFRIGGIPNITRLIEDSHSSQLTLHGPPKLVSTNLFLTDNLITNISS